MIMCVLPEPTVLEIKTTIIPQRGLSSGTAAISGAESNQGLLTISAGQCRGTAWRWVEEGVVWWWACVRVAKTENVDLQRITISKIAVCPYGISFWR